MTSDGPLCLFPPEIKTSSTPSSHNWPRRFLWPMRLLLVIAIISVVFYAYATVIPKLPKPRSEIPPPPKEVTPSPHGSHASLTTKNVTKSALRSSATSVLTSTIRLVSGNVRVGDTAHFVIQAKDVQGRNKTFGGDFWLPVLTSESGEYPTTGWRTAGHVVDHSNGTYSVFFYIGWEGTVYIHVALAASSEAARWLRENYWPVEKRIFWKAEFLNKHYRETSSCYLLRNATSSSLCPLGYNPKATGLTVLYCDKPKLSRCEDFRRVWVDSVRINNRTLELMNQTVTKLFHRENDLQTLRQGPKTINVSKLEAQNGLRSESQKLNVCKPDDTRLVNDGIWLNASWHHLQCHVRRWDNATTIKNCLRHKHVFIHGDSNVRCWYAVIAKKLGYPWRHVGKGAYMISIHHHYIDSDIEMSFYFHPQVASGAKLTLKSTKYEVDVLDSISRDVCHKYIIVLCPWGHFTQWTRDSFVERSTLLKQAVLRLRERCPDVPIVMKGAHPREHQTTTKTVFASDYTLWAWGEILREMFRNTGVFYYDVWQMNLAYGKPDMHMPLQVIDEEVNWFLSYVCKSN